MTAPHFDHPDHVFDSDFAAANLGFDPEPASGHRDGFDPWSAPTMDPSDPAAAHPDAVEAWFRRQAERGNFEEIS